LSTTSKTLEPFAIRWVGENYNAPWPIALYGLMLLFAGIAYFILTKALIAHGCLTVLGVKLVGVLEMSGRRL